MTVTRLGTGAAVFPRNGRSLNSSGRRNWGPAGSGTEPFRAKAPAIQVKCYLIISRANGEFDSTGIRPSSLLKWLNSLYRPAVPEGIRGAISLRRFSGPSIGASPSGKAVDFDSTIRRFESSRPSQPVRHLEILPLAI